LIVLVCYVGGYMVAIWWLYGGYGGYGGYDGYGGYGGYGDFACLSWMVRFSCGCVHLLA